MTTKLDTTPPIYNMTLYRGDTRPITFSYRIRLTGELQSLTGATALMQLRSSALSETVIYEFPLTVDETENTITLPIEDLDAATWTTGVYDLEVTYGSIVEVSADSKVVEVISGGTIWLENEGGGGGGAELITLKGEAIALIDS